jgi:hypothetical protein
MLKRRKLTKKDGELLRKMEKWGHLTLTDIPDEFTSDPQYAMICDCGNECFVRVRHFTDKYKVKCCFDVELLPTGYIAPTLSDPTLVDPCCCRRCETREERAEEYAFRDKCKKERANPMGRPKSTDPGRVTSLSIPDSLREQIEAFAENNKIPVGMAIKTLINKGLVMVLEEESQ